MTPEEFQKSLADVHPPSSVPPCLQALWYDAKGDWIAAHTIIQDLDDVTAAWIHAYLHRKEGDTGNADYWYRRTGRKRPGTSLHEEWETIVAALVT